MTMYTSIEKAMKLIMIYGTIFKFKECISGLYYYDMTSTDEHNSAKTNVSITPYSLLSTVTKNKQFYTYADIEGEDRARIYHRPLDLPATSTFKTYVNNNLLLNCNITGDDKNRAENIYGEANPFYGVKLEGRNQLCI